MNIKIEIEVKAKALEIYKKILNKNNTIILFNDNTNDVIVNRTTIKNRSHEFRIEKKQIEKETKVFNDKYNVFIPKKLRKLKNINQKISEVGKIKFLKIFKPILGNIFNIKTTLTTKYIINYNGIVYNIKLNEYEKLIFYAEYAYKIYQLRKLNKELGIDQNIIMYFDEDVLSTNMYNKFFDIMRGVL